jgi:hypothetical protein
MIFPDIFYLQFLEQGKTTFELAKVWANLNSFEIFFNPVGIRAARHCAARARLSASAAARHYGRGPPVSPLPPPLFGRACGMATPRRLRPPITELPRAAPGPPLSSSFSPPRDAEPRDPRPPFFLSTCTTGPLKRSRALHGSHGPDSAHALFKPFLFI